MSEKINKIELNKIYLGDCIELSKKLPDNYIDLIVTSPPYADTISYGKKVKVFNPEEYINWLLELFQEASRFLKPTGSFILNINDKIKNGNRSTYVFELICRIIKETNLKLFDRYIWFKKSSSPMNDKKRLYDRIEYIFHFVKNTKNFKAYTDRIREPYNKATIQRYKYKICSYGNINEDGIKIYSKRKNLKLHPLGKKPINVFRFNNSGIRNLGHPASFHPDLPKFFIKWLTDEGDIVLDPFMGSGTVAEACLKMNRKYIGFEINEKYIEIIKKRLKNVSYNLKFWV